MLFMSDYGDVQGTHHSQRFPVDNFVSINLLRIESSDCSEASGNVNPK